MKRGAPSAERRTRRRGEWLLVGPITWIPPRGVYDTQDGVLTVTIQDNYGPRGLGDYSRPYSVVGDSLTWGGTQYTKK